MIKMAVHRVGLCTRDGDPIVVLREEEGERCLTLKVNSVQANAVMRHAHKIPPFRPQTHEVIVAAIKALGAHVVDARIQLATDGQLCAQLGLSRRGKSITVPGDVADVVVVALRARAPILVADEILASFGRPDRSDPGKNQPPIPTPTAGTATKDIFHEFIGGLASLDELGP